MPVPSFQNIGENITKEQLVDFIYGHIRRLNDFLANLDTLNIQELNAEVVIAGSITGDKIAARTITANEIATSTITANEIAANTITANEIAAETITANEIAADAVTADKIDVTQLSAISANMGTITAGSITTDAEINIGTDAKIGNVLHMGESNYAGSKKIVWSSDSGIVAELEVLSGDMSIRTGGFMTLDIGSSQGLVVNKQILGPDIRASNSLLVNNKPVATQEFVNTGLDTKANLFVGYTGSVATAGGILFFANGILTGVS